MRKIHFGANPVDRQGLHPDLSLKNDCEDDRDPDMNH